MNSCSDKKLQKLKKNTFNAVVYILKLPRRATLLDNNATEDTHEEDTGKKLTILRNHTSFFKLFRNYFQILMLIHVETADCWEPLKGLFW